MKGKRRSQAQRREATRDALLKAASALFAERGYHATSLDAVAEHAGFSRGAVYYNFADKDELFLALLDRRCAERADDLRAVFADATDTSAQATGRQAAVAADRAFAATTRDKEWRALLLEFFAHAARDPAFRRRLARRVEEMRAALDDVVTQRSEPLAGRLGMEPRQLAVVIDALNLGLAAQHLLHGGRAVPPDLLSRALGLMLDGVAARAGQAR